MNNVTQAHEAWSRLTDLEIDVAKIAADGKNTKETADTLGISIITVQNKRQRAIKKLNCSNYTHVIATLIRAGVIV